MKPRPISISVLGWLFILAGLGELAWHAGELARPGPPIFWASLVRLLSILGGAFILRGRNWARWLLAAWLVYHVGLSAMHTPLELGVHGLLSAVLLFFLFLPPASAYFRGTATSGPSSHTDNQPRA